ncbi:phage holin family protein [Paraburkholderia bryophila]|uniref:Putative 3TM holin n=1 Tax=Paraburkholderia bryophila TaxID=420952 RepID=A0A329B626_9BURK|nr:phage holin family protein [Paraburkholderia bryophila]RAS15843.1 putative 3TM holin [Paraburkholderia bryophila]
MFYHFTPIALIALAAYFAAIVRVLTYRRQGARHRRHVSWIAWALVVVMGGSAIELALHAKSTGIFEAGSAVLLALFVLGVRGNVARLLWSNEP